MFKRFICSQFKLWVYKERHIFYRRCLKFRCISLFIECVRLNSSAVVMFGANFSPKFAGRGKHFPHNSWSLCAMLDNLTHKWSILADLCCVRRGKTLVTFYPTVKVAARANGGRMKKKYITEIIFCWPHSVEIEKSKH